MADRAIFSIILESVRAGIQEAQFLHGVEDQVEKLVVQLNRILWFLRDATYADQDKQKRVLEWVIPIRNHAYEAENLGEILSSKSSDDEWKSVCDNIKSYLWEDAQGEENVLAILALSYDDLSFHLKPCFLYLSRYAEDAEIEVETLYQYWMAEGMVSSEYRKGNETIMDVAERYLNELAERCMVFVQKEEVEPYRRFKSCQLHDLTRDLCISKAKEERFLQLIDYGNIHNIDEVSSISTMASFRYSVSLPEMNDAKRFVPPAKAVKRSLRSFTLDLQNGYKGKWKDTVKFKFSEFVKLRVLSLQGIKPKDIDSIGELCNVLVNHMKVPSSIRKLVHLRYFSLRNSLFLIMSASISNLKQLQTLDLRGVIFWIPNVVDLPRLNHLYLPSHIKPFPLGMKLGWHGLPKLEILEGFHNKVCNVNHLSTLTNLRKLEARVDDKLEDLEELIKQVRKLTHLQCLDLNIVISDLSSERAVAIMNDVLSCSNLVTLYIQGQLSKFPKFDSAFCQNLKTLVLRGCSIEEDPLSTLERLPNLRTLSLLDNAFIGKEMSCHAFGFPQLKDDLWIRQCLHHQEQLYYSRIEYTIRNPQIQILEP